MTGSRVGRLEDVPAAEAVAVVINVGTDLVATLAVVSAVTHARMPVVLVNCDPAPESAAHFARLSEQWDFLVVEAEACPHHEALDWVFQTIPSETVLLLDSDAEIRDATFVERMRSAFAAPTVFGAGCVHGPWWLDERSGMRPRTCLYQERPWLPCVMLRTEHVRAAAAAGRTFAPRTIYNDVMWSQGISRLLARRFDTHLVPKLRGARFVPPSVRERLRESRLPWLAWARRSYYGLRPNYVYCDTGADVYQWCKYEQELQFAGNSAVIRSTAEVHHYGGVTAERGSRGGFLRPMSSVEVDAVDRLARVHGIAWPQGVPYSTR